MWSVRLETYQGALVIARRTLDCSLWMIYVFDGLVQTHNFIPYVHIGLMMLMYSISLFFRDNFDLRFQKTVMQKLLTCCFIEVAEYHLRRKLFLSLCRSKALVDGPWLLFHFLNLYTVGMTPWTGSQSVARPPKHRRDKKNKRTQTSMP
jgi:hypothetical protein